mmetsp:Transcript_18328/g.42414  ORF Transcript_18328/g.42414 Transcript_18328/m.42414 type:complete len:372 (+) Transcript_18328:3070-4185(+)
MPIPRIVHRPIHMAQAAALLPFRTPSSKHSEVGRRTRVEGLLALLLCGAHMDAQGLCAVVGPRVAFLLPLGLLGNGAHPSVQARVNAVEAVTATHHVSTNSRHPRYKRGRWQPVRTTTRVGRAPLLVGPAPGHNGANSRGGRIPWVAPITPALEARHLLVRIAAVHKARSRDRHVLTTHLEILCSEALGKVPPREHPVSVPVAHLLHRALGLVTHQGGRDGVAIVVPVKDPRSPQAVHTDCQPTGSQGCASTCLASLRSAPHCLLLVTHESWIRERLGALLQSLVVVKVIQARHRPTSLAVATARRVGNPLEGLGPSLPVGVHLARCLGHVYDAPHIGFVSRTAGDSNPVPEVCDSLDPMSSLHWPVLVDF